MGRDVKRRHVRYQALDDLLCDAERCCARRAATTGQWSLGQIYEHLARGLDMAVDGVDFQAPWPVRWLLRTFVKNRMLVRGMPAGFKLKGQAAAALVPAAVDTEAGLEHLRRSIQRFGAETRRGRHPLFGQLNETEWNQLHLRHAELHMSFIAEES